MEGCRLAAPLRLCGQNVVVGVDVEEPLELPAGACLDVIAGETRAGRRAWFVRAITSATRSRTRSTRRHARRPAAGRVAGRRWGEGRGRLGRRHSAGQAEPVGRAGLSRRRLAARLSRLALDVRSGHGLRGGESGIPAADRYSVAEIALLADMDAFYSGEPNSAHLHAIRTDHGRRLGHAAVADEPRNPAETTHPVHQRQEPAGDRLRAARRTGSRRAPLHLCRREARPGDPRRHPRADRGTSFSASRPAATRSTPSVSARP